ncbi:MAG: acyltransferase [Bacteroides sp.]|nr:acyltransferase [Bacteroides sp.]
MCNKEFDEIRPYHDSELPQVYEELLSDDNFKKVISAIMPDIPFELVAQKMRACKTKLDFQKAFCYGFIKDITKKQSTGVSLDISELSDKEKAYTYVSNHRDIILDSGLLSVYLVDKGLTTVEIAIGDNLLIYPWIKKLVRINKSFIVQRGISMRQILESSTRLSRYMHHTIADKGQSIWIAQREGRAKDSNDRTQESILKMFAMGGEGSIKERLKQLNISPMTISYEYDPCDFLKVKEFILKNEDREYKKTQMDDLINMQTGLFGYKGEVNIKLAECINNFIDTIDDNTSKQDLYRIIAEKIDKDIHRNYVIYKGNYIAYDMLNGKQEFADKYTNEDVSKFKDYMRKQLGKIDVKINNTEFAEKHFLLMYANPLKNHLESKL